MDTWSSGGRQMGKGWGGIEKPNWNLHKEVLRNYKAQEARGRAMASEQYSLTVSMDAFSQLVAIAVLLSLCVHVSCLIPVSI